MSLQCPAASFLATLFSFLLFYFRALSVPLKIKWFWAKQGRVSRPVFPQHRLLAHLVCWYLLGVPASGAGQLFALMQIFWNFLFFLLLLLVWSLNAISICLFLLFPCILSFCLFSSFYQQNMSSDAYEVQVHENLVLSCFCGWISQGSSLFLCALCSLLFCCCFLLNFCCPPISLEHLCVWPTSQCMFLKVLALVSWDSCLSPGQRISIRLCDPFVSGELRSRDGWEVVWERGVGGKVSCGLGSCNARGAFPSDAWGVLVAANSMCSLLVSGFQPTELVITFFLSF